MSRSIIVSLSDTDYEALQSVSAAAHQTVEEVIAVAISSMTRPAGKLPTTPMTSEEAQQAKDALLAVMRSRGHLADPTTAPPHPGAADLPPVGSPERAQLEDELADVLGEAFEASGMSILDLIDR